MSDNQALEMQLIKTLYSKYQQEIITIDGVFIKVQFNGLSEIINVDIKQKPYSTKMLIADLRFINKSLEISNNVNESKVKNMVLRKLNQYPTLLSGITLFVKDNGVLEEQFEKHLEQIESIEQREQQIKANRIFRKIDYLYFNEEEDTQKVINDYKIVQSELLNKITKSNKTFLLNLTKDYGVDPKQAVVKLLLNKVFTNPTGSLLLLKIFKS